MIDIWDWVNINNKEAHHPPAPQWSRGSWKRLITTPRFSKHECDWDVKGAAWNRSRGTCLCTTPGETVETQTMYALIKIYCVQQRWCHRRSAVQLCLYNWFIVYYSPAFLFICFHLFFPNKVIFYLRALSHNRQLQNYELDGNQHLWHWKFKSDVPTFTGSIYTISDFLILLLHIIHCYLTYITLKI